MFIFRKIGNFSEEANILSEVSEIYSKMGDYNSALKYMKDAYNIKLQKGQVKEIGIALNNIGVYFYKMNDYENAIISFKDAFKRFDSIKSSDIQYPIKYLHDIVEDIGEAKFQEIISKMS